MAGDKSRAVQSGDEPADAGLGNQARLGSQAGVGQGAESRGSDAAASQATRASAAKPAAAEALSRTESSAGTAASRATEPHRAAQLDHSAEQLVAEQRAKAVEEEAGALQAHEVSASQATRAPAAKPTLSGVAVDPGVSKLFSIHLGPGIQILGSPHRPKIEDRR